MSSKTIEITSSSQFKEILSSSRGVVADFYADWCGPCKQIAPIYESLSATYSRKDLVTFVKINTDNLRNLTVEYNISAYDHGPKLLKWLSKYFEVKRVEQYNQMTLKQHMLKTSSCKALMLNKTDGLRCMPTILYFEDGEEKKRIQGGNQSALNGLIDRWKTLASGNAPGGSSSAKQWLGYSLPRGYKDVTEQVDIKNLELLNNDADFGNARTLFENAEPTSLGKGKAASSSSSAPSGNDWVESDTDAQLMLFVPFQSILKIHSIQITSLPPAADDDDDERPMRPRELRFFTNRSHTVGFDEDIEPTQSMELKAEQWDASTGTANIELRFVKFQKVHSLCIFVVDGDGESDKTRIDRVRIIGESGEKRDMGKLEKIGDEAGE